MQRCLLLCLRMAILGSFVGFQARAGEPKKKPDAEWVPVPQQMILPQKFHSSPYPTQPRPGSRDMWQYYAVDSFGRWRPRVILSPEGAYDMRTLAPYPWITNRPNAFLANELGAPAGSYEPRPGIAQPFIPFARSTEFMPSVEAPWPPVPSVRFMPYAVD